MIPLTRRPELALLPTGIGSLPHRDPSTACSAVLASFDGIPFWPQLPARGFGENMYAQFASDLPGVSMDFEKKKISADSETRLPVELDGFFKRAADGKLAYDERYFSGLFAMLDKGKELRKAKAVKGQVTGPISLGMQVFEVTSGKPVIYDELYRDIIVKALNSKVRLQEEMLRRTNDRVIVFIDEPSLSLFGTPYLNLSREEIAAALTGVFEGAKCLKGVHCCGNTDWSLLLELPFDLISFDAYGFGDRMTLYAKELKEFVARGGALSFGIVPSTEETLGSEDVTSLAGRFDALLERFVGKGVPGKDLLGSALLTPSCGLAGIGEGSSGKALRMTRELSDLLRRRYGLGGEGDQ